MLDAADALKVGFVDELAEADQVVSRARDWLGSLLKLPPQAMTNTRRLARADLTLEFADPGKLAIDEFVDAWFSGESQTTLKALVAKLKGGK